MNLAPLLAALGMAQAGMVAPALDEGYAQGSAGTIAMVLLMLAQDAATRDERRAGETAAMAALLGRHGSHDDLLGRLDVALTDAEARGDRALERAVLDLYVAMADGAFVTPPAL